MNDGLLSATQPATLDQRILPQPPRMHWGVLLALHIVTLGLFQLVWLVVQALWVKRMTGKSTGLTWAIVNLCSIVGFILIMVTIGAVGGATGHITEAQQLGNLLSGASRLLFVVLNLATVFTLRGQMDNYPIRMPLSGVMTFFFQSVYFQYHMHDYVLPDAAEVYGEMPKSPAYVPPTTSPEPTL